TATRPGARSPSRAGHASDAGAVSRNVAGAYGGSAASAATPSVACIAARAAGALLAQFTAFTTTGIVASFPSLSVLVSSRSRNVVSPLSNLIALPRSIRCGKSTFHGCGGTYGHFVM